MLSVLLNYLLATGLSGMIVAAAPIDSAAGELPRSPDSWSLSKKQAHLIRLPSSVHCYYDKRNLDYTYKDMYFMLWDAHQAPYWESCPSCLRSNSHTSYV